MFRVGLTGGIGSGKSMAAELFMRLGATIVDADRIAKQLIDTDPALLEKIKHRFGAHIADANGALDRKQLRLIIFADAAQRSWLEQLLHPLILAEMNRQTQQSTAPYVIFMAPLLLEATDPYSWVDRVLVIDVSEAVQIQRCMQRDGISAEQALQIIRAQLPRQQRLQRADDVIDNDGDRAALERQVEALHQRYLQLGSKQG